MELRRWWESSDSFFEIVSELVCQVFAAGNAGESEETSRNRRGNVCINCRNDLTGSLKAWKAGRQENESGTIRFRRLSDEDCAAAWSRRYLQLVKPLRKLFLSLDLLRVYPIVASCKARLVGVQSFSPVHPMKTVYRFLPRITMLPFPASLW